MGWGNAGWTGDDGWYLNKATGGSNPVPTFIGAVAATNGGGNMTASAVPIGAASATRRVIVLASYDSGASPSTISGVTIGGVSATLHAAIIEGGISDSGVAIASLIVAAGTTATIVATGPSTAGIFGIYTVDNSTLVSGTPTTGTHTQTATNTDSTSLTVSAGGFIVSVFDKSGGANVAFTTPGATQDFISASGQTIIFSQTGVSAGTATPSVTSASGAAADAMASASWR